LDQKVRDGHGTQRQDWAQLAAASGGAVTLIAPFSAEQARRFATGVGSGGPKQNHTRRVTALPPAGDASTHDLQPPVDSHLDLVDARPLSDDILIIAHTVAPTGGGAGCEADRTGGDLPQLTLYAVLPPTARVFKDQILYVAGHAQAPLRRGYRQAGAFPSH